MKGSPTNRYHFALAKSEAPDEMPHYAALISSGSIQFSTIKTNLHERNAYY